MALRADSPYVVIPVSSGTADVYFWQTSYAALLMHMNLMMQHLIPMQPCEWGTSEASGMDDLLNYLAPSDDGIRTARNHAKHVRPTTAAPTSTGTPPSTPLSKAFAEPRLPARLKENKCTQSSILSGPLHGFDSLDVGNDDLDLPAHHAVSEALPSIALDATSLAKASSDIDGFDAALAEHAEIVQTSPRLSQLSFTTNAKQPSVGLDSLLVPALSDILWGDDVQVCSYGALEVDFSVDAADPLRTTGPDVVASQTAKAFSGNGNVFQVVGSAYDLCDDLEAPIPKHCFLCSSCLTYYACERSIDYHISECCLGAVPEHGCYNGEGATALCAECL